MADLRSALEAAMEQAEDGTLQAPEEREIEVENEPLRNEKGQFVSKDAEEPTEEAPQAEAESAESQAEPVEAKETEEEATDPEEYQPTVPRPSTWKKEYLKLWDKVDRNEPLSQEEAHALLKYNVQRENEYKKGVSAYKAEADNAKALTEAISPFIPELQQNGIHPAAWINNLGRAHVILSKAPYEQKLSMFNQLAQSYGIDLNSAYGGNGTTQYQDPQSQLLMQQIQALQQQVQQVGSWKEQQEQSRLMSEIEQFSADKPHFDAVREQMAQLLERGLAQDLNDAYTKAVRLNDEVFQAEQQRLIKETQSKAQNAQRVAKAKAAAVSTKSATPSGQVVKAEVKDRRSLLEEQLGSALNNRL